MNLSFRKSRRDPFWLSMPSVLTTLCAIALVGCQPMAIDAPISEWSLDPVSSIDAGKSRIPGGVNLSSNRGGGTSSKTARVMGTGRFLGAGSATTKSSEPLDPENAVTLNLVNLPAAQAAKIVLGDICGVNYVIDPKIDAKVTVHTAGKVDKSEAVNLFRTALKSIGADIVDADGVYRIVPSDQALTSGMKVSPNPPSNDAIGDQINVVQLKYVSASEMKRILEPVSPKGSLMRADDARGLITLGGSPQEIATMRDTIRLFDVDAMRGMSFALIPVRSAEPESLSEDLKKVFSTEAEGPMNGMIRFVPNKRLKSILIISPQQKYLERAEAWIKKLDSRAAGGEKQFYTYPVQNRPAKDLAGVLNSLFASETGAAGATNRQVSPRMQQASFSSPAATAGGATGGMTGTTTGGAGGAFGAGGNAGLARAMAPNAPSAGAGLGGNDPQTGQTNGLGDDTRMKISADDANNALLIMATPEDYKRLQQVIQNLDVMPNQVLIEATIAEVTLNDQLKFGVRWYLNQNGSSGTFTDAASGVVGTVFPGFSYALKLSNAQVTVHALQQVTDVNVISSPSLMVMDNKTATLQVGDQVPITTQSAQSVVSVGAPVVNSVTYKDTGIILSITPRINDSGRVMLDIEQEVSNVVPTTSSAIDSPTIQQRRVRTSVVVNDSESLTLGGLVQDRNNVGKTQIPVLGDLPLVGNAFKVKTDLTGKTELIIIITPKVVRNLAEAQAVTDEFRSRLRFAYPRPRTAPRRLQDTVKRTVE